jgi:hypothetical protein
LVLGRDPADGNSGSSPATEWDRDRIVRYDSLLGEARRTYEEFLRARSDAGRVSRLLDEIDADGM